MSGQAGPWVILALTTFSSHLSNLPYPQIKVEEETSNFRWSESVVAYTESL